MKPSTFQLFNLSTLAAVVAATAAYAAVPEVTSCAMSQNGLTRTVTVTYTLSSHPAVVTLDIQTNAVANAETGWVSIGGEYICNAEGDVWKKVDKASGVITWQPDLSWKDENGDGFRVADGKARAVVTAYAMDNTPDYMVVDISQGAQANTQHYYPAVDFLPGSELGQKGAITNNPAYKEGLLVMRKIMAKNVRWLMGCNSLEPRTATTTDAAHEVTLTNNYYIGVFEVTQGQWAGVQTARPTPSRYNNQTYRIARPVEEVCYNEIRNAANSTTADTAYDWPNDPNPDSFLGILRTRTGIDFDLPSEAEWEFAARAGYGSGKWGNGSAMLQTDGGATVTRHYAKCTNLDKIGRYGWNGGFKNWQGYIKGDYTRAGNSCAPSNATATVGTYLPNAWGIYDMHGNVQEWCLDWYEADISAYNGKVNVDFDTPAQTLSGTAGANRVIRGGHWMSDAQYCRGAARTSWVPTGRHNNSSNSVDWGNYGFRLCCRAGLE